MYIEQALDAARERLAPMMAGQVSDWLARANRLLGPAAAQGLINSPTIHAQVAEFILDEIRARGALCAEAVMAGDDAETSGASPEVLAAAADLLLGEHIDDLARMRDGFADLGRGQTIPSLVRCLSEGRRAIEERISAATLQVAD
ncbi:MAG: hypothetical protein QMC79_07625 [Anaerosomatales bacterium]|nr:hypothetical protein [Anaerosomatales bacterium]